MGLLAPETGACLAILQRQWTDRAIPYFTKYDLIAGTNASIPTPEPLPPGLDNRHRTEVDLEI
jgi:hypothetical protein